MLGSEYNWLVSLSSHPVNGTPQVRMARTGLITLAVAVFCFLSVALRASPAADETAWTIGDMDGIIEGIALHPVTGEAFFSDVHNRCIWYRDVSGPSAVMKPFSAEADGLLGVFALKIDEPGRTLWASSSALPEMKGYAAADAGRALLAAYDLSTRKLRRTYPLPADGRAHVLGDFVLAKDGSVYVTDSFAPVIWRLAPGGDRLEKWLERGDFKNLQGIALAADHRSLYVADYSRGVWQVGLSDRSATLLAAPEGINLKGLDGIYTVPGGLVAVQNGTKTQRILRLALGETGAITAVRELRSGDPRMTDLSLGQVAAGQLHFIADSGWSLFANPAASPAPRAVTILRTRIN